MYNYSKNCEHKLQAFKLVLFNAKTSKKRSRINKQTYHRPSNQTHASINRTAKNHHLKSPNPQKPWGQVTYNEVGEIDDGPSHARRAAKNGQDKKPCEEEDEDVGGPHTRIRKPLGVFVQIGRWHGLDVQIRHQNSKPRFCKRPF